MAATPQTLVSSLSSTRYSAGKFWTTRVGTFVLIAAFLYALQLFLTPNLGIYDMRILVNSLLYATLAVSLNLINGITGQFSMGHAAFYLSGAIISGKISSMYYKTAGVPGWLWLPLMVVVGAVGAALIGLLVGIPSLRLRGDYLAVMTMGFGEIARVIVINQDGGKQAFGGLDLGGAYGLQGVPKLTEMYHLLLLLIVAIALSRNLLKTAHGLSFLSVREDELAADATGVHSTRIKVTAFTIGAAIAGMAGALFAHYNRSVSPDDFKMDVSFMLVAMVVIGGTGSITGAVISGVSLKVLEEGLRALPGISATALYGFLIALIVTVLLAKQVFKRIEGPARVTFDKALIVPGLIGLGCALFGAYRLWGADMSVVIKVAFVVIALALNVAMLLPSSFRTALPKFGGAMVVLALAYGVSFGTQALLHKIAPLAAVLDPIKYQAADLRWAIFSLALVIVMLNRPQGIMSHQEFSWDFIKGIFGKKKAIGVAP